LSRKVQVMAGAQEACCFAETGVLLLPSGTTWQLSSKERPQ